MPPVARISLGPSAASRWFYCKASPGFLARNAHRLPKEEAPWADEGSLAHEHAAAALLMGYDEDAGFPNAQMAECVRGYQEFVAAQISSGDRLVVESKVPLFYNPSRNGIVDAAILGSRRLVINDLKYGQGVSVEAERNMQLAIYAWGFILEQRVVGIHLPDSAEVTLNIYQPRARDGRVVRSWTITVAELEAFLRPVGAAAKAILADPHNQPFHSDDKVCQFCDAKALCPTYAAKQLEAIPSDVGEDVSVSQALGVVPATELTVEQLATLVATAPRIRQLLDAAEKMALGILKDGQSFPGHKLVRGKTNRKWADETDAHLFLSKWFKDDQLLTKTLLSPSQAESLLKSRKLLKVHATRFNRLVTRPEGAVTMVPDNDPRPAITAAADALAEFQNLNDSKSSTDESPLL